MKVTPRLLSVLVVVLSAVSVACSNGMQPYSSQSSLNSDPAVGTLPQTDFNKLETSTALASQSVVDADKILSSLIGLNGGFQLPSLPVGQGFGGFVSSRIKPLLDKVLTSVGQARLTLNTARQQIVDALSKLDQSNPAHAALISKMMEIMVKFDALEAKINAMKSALAGRVDLISNKIDQFVSKLNPILQVLLMIEVNNVKELLQDFKTRLLAL